MTLRKLFAIAVSSGVLGAQLLTIMPPRAYQFWYWPFLDYPMYSDVYHAGAAVAEHRLVVMPCFGGMDGRVLEAPDLEVVRFRLIYLLRDAVAQESANGQLRTFIGPAGSAHARRTLETMVTDRFPGEYCRLRIQERAFTAGEPIPADLEGLWHDLWEADLSASDEERR